MSVNMHTAMRAETVTLLRTYGDTAGIGLQVYPALPTTIKPPTAYIERMTEQLTQTGVVMYQRLVRCSVMVLFREFAAGERADAAAQKDAFCDGFMSYVEQQVHISTEPNSTIRPASVDDLPEFVLQGPRGVITYFGARITLEGYVETT